MDPFGKRQLGRTKVRLPQLWFGGVPLGNFFEAISNAQAEATMAAAWDAGIRFYDTSHWYGRGLSECRIGSFLLHQPREEGSALVERFHHATHRPGSRQRRNRRVARCCFVT